MAHWHGRTRETVGASPSPTHSTTRFALVLLGVVSASGVTVLSGTVTRDRLNALRR